MPDWSYRTFLRPALLRLGPERARRFAVRTLSLLGRVTGGWWLIDFLGHMRPDVRLTRTIGRHQFIGPVGLSAFVDPEGRALAALGRFGGGFVEIGPIAEQSQSTSREWKVDLAAQSISGAEQVYAASEIEAHLASASGTPVFLRLAPMENEEAVRLAQRFAPLVTGLVVTATSGGNPETLCAVTATARKVAPDCLVLFSITPESATPEKIASATQQAGADGVWLRAERSLGDGRFDFGAAALEAVQAVVPALRTALGSEPVLTAAGVLQPDDARGLLNDGASLVAVDAGLVLSGPGLIKRTNEALAGQRAPSKPPEALSLEAARHSWFWLFVLGVAMLLGGVLATALACSRVLLPYDEALCGIPRGAFAAINPRLLHFMAHDRMSLAGTMLSIGILYSAIAWQAVRRGQHWAKIAIVVSAMTGFFSFFLFLAFGYFDPFHAFVTAVLLQFVILALHSPLTERIMPSNPEWSETAAWRRGQWGQLLFVLNGIGLIGAGIVICLVGCTAVFVDTDLEFLRTTAAQLLVSHERLVPLVAHDRASLGGMLIANGVVIWLTAQWGFRAGERWLWWTLAIAGNVAFAAAVGVHLVVGYLNWEHLIPALTGWTMWLLALGLTRGWMVPRIELPLSSTKPA